MPQADVGSALYGTQRHGKGEVFGSFPRGLEDDKDVAHNNAPSGLELTALL
jgi:hypothetical protein